MAKTLHFKTNTLLKNLVGKDLINDDNIAIIELVKNAYDARSKEVVLRFEDFSINKSTNAESSRIIIADKGAGMTEQGVKDKWLNISCDRLGSTLDMLTRSNSGELIHIHINWKDFEKEGMKNLTIQKVPIKFDFINDSKALKISGLTMPKTGTILVISKLRSIWKREELINLKRGLEKFINPNQLFLHKQFKIKIEADEFKKEEKLYEYHDKVDGIIKNLVFEKLKFNTTYIESSINGDGSLITTELYHEGECVFKLQEKNTRKLKLKNVNIVIYYLNPYKKAYFKRQTGVRLIDFGSIFLFLNGFRVAPYGERGNDWLMLDSRKSQGQARYLGNRDIVGRVEVIGSEDNFKPISSREGLKTTPDFSALKENYFLDTLRRLERFVVDGLDWDSVPSVVRTELRNSNGLNWDATSEKYIESWDKKRKRISLAIMTLIGVSKEKVTKLWFNASLLDGLSEQRSQEISVIINEIEGFGGDIVDDDLKKNLKQIGKIIAKKDEDVKSAKRQVTVLKIESEEKQEAIDKLKKETKGYQAQTLFLKSVTTLDEKTLLGFHHQICLDSSIIDNYVGRAMKALRDKENINEALKYIEKISKANKKILATAQYATKANFKSGSKRVLTDIPSYFEQYLNHVTKDFVASGLKLSIDNQVPTPFEIKAKRIELSILIDNIISNADKAHANSLKITLSLKDKNRLIISFEDDGRGLDDSVKLESIFDLGVTSTSGSGLGLYHVKQIMDSLDAEVSLVPKSSKGVVVEMIFIK